MRVMGKLIRFFLSYVGGFFALCGCTSDHVLGPTELLFASSKQMEDLSHIVWDRINSQEKTTLNQDRSERVLAVVERLAIAANRNSDNGDGADSWKVIVLRSDYISATVLPNNKAIATEGLLDFVETDDELAVVFANLIAHVNYNHPGERFSQSILRVDQLAVKQQEKTYLSNQAVIDAVFGIANADTAHAPFSREHSLVADQFSVRYLQRAGYDVNAAPRFWRKLSRLDSRGAPLLSFHPVDETRIKRLESEIALIMRLPRG